MEQMISWPVFAFAFLAYVALLFALAFYADSRHAQGRSIVANSWVYSLALAVYITSWTFYGTVGRAATVGFDYLPPLLGPTLVAFCWWFLLRKMVRVCKEHNITTIADLISSRYGKSGVLGTLVTLFAILGITPYIALQLKAVSQSLDVLLHGGAGLPASGVVQGIDTALLIALVIAFFAILFGARHLDSTERHEGLVAVIALESVVKLAALLAVGLFVTYGLFDGASDLFARFVHEFPERRHLLALGTEQIPYARWFTLIVVGMVGVMVFPHQFHVMVIENSDESHIKEAMWLFPTYLFLSGLFILPIALGGLLQYGGDLTHAEYFTLSLPLDSGNSWLALLVFIGGFSAASGMIILSAVALAPMILNHLAMPIILRFKALQGGNLPGLLINIKRLGIVLVVMIGYLYFRIVGEYHTLANIGLASFIAAAQFAPALIGGLFWKRANFWGALVGLTLGFLVWFYTLLVPAFVLSGWIRADLLQNGLFGWSFLRPTELFGLRDLDLWSHALFFSYLANIGAFVALSLLIPAGRAEQAQADRLIDIFSPSSEAPMPRQRISKAPTVIEMIDLMTKFMGEKPAHAAAAEFLRNSDIDQRGSLPEDQLVDLKKFAERTLAGAVGTAPARIIMENYMAARGSEMQDVFDIFGSVTIARRAGREQLGILYETARLVAGGGELPIILDNILDLLRQQFSFDLCIIRLLDEERRVLSVWAQKGASAEYFETAERDLTMDTYAGECFLTNSVQVVNDTSFVDRPVPLRIVRTEGIKSFAHAPITIEGEPIGVLTAHSRSAKGIFTDEFIELFSSLAGLIGVAWRNARQVEKLMRIREKERELEIAREIQMGLLPTRVPAIGGIFLAGVCLPAQEVGGDYFDYLQRDTDVLDLVIADVSGHNVGSALTMGWIRTFIQDRARHQRLSGAGAILREINEFFYEDLSRADLFVSMFYLSYDSRSRVLSYGNAGHNPPLLYRREAGTFAWLDAEGMLLGIRKKMTFEEKKEVLGPGDVLVLYTDGLTEAESPEGAFFGIERLRGTIMDGAHLPPAEIIESLVARARAFTGSENFRDDISLVVMKVEG